METWTNQNIIYFIYISDDANAVKLMSTAQNVLNFFNVYAALLSPFLWRYIIIY